MTQEDKKQLLLKDLYAKQPWGVKVQYNNKVYAIDYVSAEYEEVKLDILDNYTVGIFDIKPYLRPMSSMTDKEKEEFSVLAIGTHLFKGPLIPSYDTLDWLNSHHFDYRGLILKGLALEAPNDMYK